MGTYRMGSGFGGLLWALLPLAAAQAETATAVMNVSATVPANCSLSAGNLGFGAIDPKTTVTATANLTVNCPQGLAYQVSIDAGQHYDAERGLRTMTGSNGGKARYSLLKNAEGSGQWGDNDFARTYLYGGSVSGVGSGGVQTLTVYGRVEPAGNAGLQFPGGNYSDQLLVTVHY